MQEGAGAEEEAEEGGRRRKGGGAVKPKQTRGREKQVKR